ncbi:hypothetical protein FKM82_017870 [Ascaphus truei]
MTNGYMRRSGQTQPLVNMNEFRFYLFALSFWGAFLRNHIRTQATVIRSRPVRLRLLCVDHLRDACLLLLWHLN